MIPSTCLLAKLKVHFTSIFSDPIYSDWIRYEDRHLCLQHSNGSRRCNGYHSFVPHPCNASSIPFRRKLPPKTKLETKRDKFKNSWHHRQDYRNLRSGWYWNARCSSSTCIPDAGHLSFEAQKSRRARVLRIFWGCGGDASASGCVEYSRAAQIGDSGFNWREMDPYVETRSCHHQYRSQKDCRRRGDDTSVARWTCMFGFFGLFSN